MDRETLRAQAALAFAVANKGSGIPGPWGYIEVALKEADALLSALGMEDAKAEAGPLAWLDSPEFRDELAERLRLLPYGSVAMDAVIAIIRRHAKARP